MMPETKTILVVDDNESNISLLLDILHQYDLIPALDGRIAFDIACKEKIDLILLDVMMPNVNGFDVCKMLKENPFTVDIPIIFITAKPDIEDIKYGFELGAIDYITKPIIPEELKIRIKNHLELITYRNNLRLQVQKELEKNKLHQEMLFQHSKQAEIGELMMHISHQWKQSLSELGSINTLLFAKLERDSNLEREQLMRDLQKNANIISFMADTMETFKDFYNPNQHGEEFNVKKAIDSSLNMVSATFDYNNIDLDLVCADDLKLSGIKNELSQIMLVLLNNAKNIFMLRNIKKPSLKIEVCEKNKKIYIIIKDNGGGIQLENPNDIFTLFVSHNNSTGIGLYMANAICKKNGWKIEVKDVDDGAVFIIKGKIQ